MGEAQFLFCGQGTEERLIVTHCLKKGLCVTTGHETAWGLHSLYITMEPFCSFPGPCRAHVLVPGKHSEDLRICVTWTLSTSDLRGKCLMPAGRQMSTLWWDLSRTRPRIVETELLTSSLSGPGPWLLLDPNDITMSFAAASGTWEGRGCGPGLRSAPAGGRGPSHQALLPSFSLLPLSWRTAISIPGWDVSWWGSLIRFFSRTPVPWNRGIDNLAEMQWD